MGEEEDNSLDGAELGNLAMDCDLQMSNEINVRCGSGQKLEKCAMSNEQLENEIDVSLDKEWSEDDASMGAISDEGKPNLMYQKESTNQEISKNTKIKEYKSPKEE